MVHSAADVVAHLLVDLGLATGPGPGAAWPVHVTNEPDLPDDCITVYKTEGRSPGRLMFTGETVMYPGVQVRVRSARPDTGWVKADAIRVALSESVYQRTVHMTIDGTHYHYLVHCLHEVGDVIHAGVDRPRSERDIHTVNVLVDLKQLP